MSIGSCQPLGGWELDLATFSPEERELTVALVEQIYSLIEVRFDIANEPRWGECLGERRRYTPPPGT